MHKLLTILFIAITTVTGCTSDEVKNKWCKTKINLIGFVFSKNDYSYSSSQFLKITNNTLDAEGITNITGQQTNTFGYVNISGNDILNARYLHLGTTPVNDYLYSNNYLINSAYPLSGYLKIKNFIIK